MRYTIEGIKGQAKEIGWQVVSEKYINMKTEMEFICPEGHHVLQTYDKWRHRPQCPMCQETAEIKNVSVKIKTKNYGEKRTLALDQSTQVTGWAVFDNDKLIHCGVLTATQATAVERIETMRQYLVSMLTNWKPDRVILEGIQLQELDKKTNGKWEGNNTIGVTTFQTLAQLQGVLMNCLYNSKVPFEVVHTATWREASQVKGRCRADKKRSAQLIVKNKYDISVSQDEADAILIGRYSIVKDERIPKRIEW